MRASPGKKIENEFEKHQGSPSQSFKTAYLGKAQNMAVSGCCLEKAFLHTGHHLHLQPSERLNHCGPRRTGCGSGLLPHSLHPVKGKDTVRITQTISISQFFGSCHLLAKKISSFLLLGVLTIKHTEQFS